MIFGAPGVGKGTQATALQALRGVPHVSTGDMLRAAIRDGTPQGIRARSIVERGELVPDDLIGTMIGERLRGEDVRDGFILDGFPRTVGQAEYLDRLLGERGQPLGRVVNIVVPEGEIALRLAGRRVCSQCGANYHESLRPPRTPGRCDACGGVLAQRRDDTLLVIRERLRVYEEQTAPLLEYYRRRGLLVTIDGRGWPEEVAGRIGAALAIREE